MGARTTTGGNSSRSTKAEAQQRQLRAVELRTQGRSFDEIATELGYSDRSAAHHAYTAAMRAMPEVDDRETMIRVECTRLDALQAAQWPKALKGDSEAARTIIRIMQRRARMLGLDAPTKLEHKVTAELDAEIEQMLAEMAGQPAPAPGHPG